MSGRADGNAGRRPVKSYGAGLRVNVDPGNLFEVRRIQRLGEVCRDVLGPYASRQ